MYFLIKVPGAEAEAEARAGAAIRICGSVEQGPKEIFSAPQYWILANPYELINCTWYNLLLLTQGKYTFPKKRLEPCFKCCGRLIM
jgi:hypothetical protein